ncbi:Transcriptional regulator, DeoR family, partial [hydrothermal vent metagenome]
AWCELRDDFRHFRLDRMTSLEPLKQSFMLIEGKRLQDYLDTVMC